MVTYYRFLGDICHWSFIAFICVQICVQISDLFRFQICVILLCAGPKSFFIYHMSDEHPMWMRTKLASRILPNIIIKLYFVSFLQFFCVFLNYPVFMSLSG